MKQIIVGKLTSKATLRLLSHSMSGLTPGGLFIIVALVNTENTKAVYIAIKKMLSCDLISVDDNPGDVADSEDAHDSYKDDGQGLVSLDTAVTGAVQECQHANCSGKKCRSLACSL